MRVASERSSVASQRSIIGVVIEPSSRLPNAGSSCERISAR